MQKYQDYQTPSRTQPEEPNSIQINFAGDLEKTEKASTTYNGCAISTQTVRRHFIRKVLGIIFCQLMVSILFILAALFITAFREFQLENTAVFLSAVFIEILLFVLMICNTKLCKKVPYNYLCLFIFTLAVSYILAYLCASTKPEAVLAATVSTASIVVLLGIYSVVTKKDLTTNVGIVVYIPVAGIILILFLTVFNVVITQIIISLIIVAIFSIFLAYDLQKLNGKFGVEYTIDEYVFAALMIYVDIVLIFKNLLYIFGGTK